VGASSATSETAIGPSSRNPRRALESSWRVWPCLQIGNQLSDEIENDLKMHVLWPEAEGMAQQQDRRIGITWLKHRQTSDRNHALTRA
jgi:hypothetical protein